MSSLIFREVDSHFTTPVPDSFILTKMPSANGVYVKVYLYVLNGYCRRKDGLTLASVAEALSLLESEVVEALRYWNAQGVLRLTFDKTADSYSIRFGNDEDPLSPDDPTKTGEKKQKKDASRQKVIRVEQRPNYTPDEMLVYKNTDPNVTELFRTAQEMLGIPLSHPNQSILISFYDYYRLPIDVVFYLLDYCVQRDKRDLRYIEKVAMDWSDHDIHSVKDAEAYVHRFDFYLPILRELHISVSQPSDDAIRMIDQWHENFGMSTEMLQEAARRTFERTRSSNPKSKLNYMNRILEDWRSKGISDLTGVQKADETFQGRGEANRGYAAAGGLNNFSDTNNYDYEEILEASKRRLMEHYEQKKEN